MRQKHHKLTWILILVTTVAPRLLVLAYLGLDRVGKFYLSDSIGYVDIARNLLAHGVFSDSTSQPLSPDLIRTPGYPLLLAAVFVIGGNELTVVALQILMGSLTALLTYFLADELGASPRAALLAALFVSLDVPSILLSDLLMTETLFTAVLLAAVWLLVRYWRRGPVAALVMSAVLLAVAALIRPIVQFLPIALLPLFAVGLRHLRSRSVAARGLAFFLISVLLMLPWVYRNYRVGDTFSISRIADRNLLYYRARAVIAETEHISQDEALDLLRAEVDTTTAEMQLNPGEKYDLMRHIALRVFTRYPIETLTMSLKGGFRFFADPGYALVCSFLDPTHITFECLPGRGTMLESGLLGTAIGKLREMNLVQQCTLLWSMVILGTLYAGAIPGVFGLARRREALTLGSLLLLVLYFVLLSSGAETNYRFRVPVVPFLTILAGYGYQWMMGLASPQ